MYKALVGAKQATSVLEYRPHPGLPRQKFGWDQDAVKGGLTSIQILLIWVTAQGNYSQWLATTIDREDNENFCLENQNFLWIQVHIEQDPRVKSLSSLVMPSGFVSRHDAKEYPF
ncbi:uncharacterized protein PGTG_14875 [Puccinia graminis f. sp. tritici CRL 75-36-700-3]|uniref:Uncharacterized protein n=1 Tax=Puccinia graminis f. sp. tritici (strain CRL 75-36-700-3 / race SCCL) TaxID=418459 RepID=E3KXU8_PUCGT|nr:uncharacterized protein PGTG_14875 [Puccinia graminis f. sp. tritici CRL 75-36-700-3]EFP89034.1 hypothetical protein PGTG_14875 [Puccinia graminis f. sp. tritici CRL 75-36-700-3]